VYRQQGPAPTPAAEYLGEVPAAKTLRFLVGVRGNFVLWLTRLHIEAVLEGAFLDDACQFFSQHADQGGDQRNDHGPDKNPDEPKRLKPAQQSE